jgi:uncharacterized membrane protein
VNVDGLSTADGGGGAQYTQRDHLRHHRGHAHMESAFGSDLFGKLAERFARLFGTPKFILGQSAIVAAWIAANAVGITHFDLYPFILLNLAFSTQAAYAAPLILLAATRQAERDRAATDADARHREELHGELKLLLLQNTELTEQVHQLTREVREHIVSGEKRA